MMPWRPGYLVILNNGQAREPRDIRKPVTMFEARLVHLTYMAIARAATRS
jgi:hypothetical protein